MCLSPRERASPSLHASRAVTRLTVYRAHQVARSDQKTEDSSESVNSFHSGAIFWHSLGHETSGNAFVGPILFPERISSMLTVFGHDPVTRKMLELSTFFWSFSALFRRFRVLLRSSGLLGSVPSERNPTREGDSILWANFSVQDVRT